MVIKYVLVERHIPASFKRKCAASWSKPGGPAVTGDWIDRGDVNEAALIKCSAQIDKIIAWDKS